MAHDEARDLVDQLVEPADASMHSAIFWFSDSPAATTCLIRNNVVHVAGFYWVANRSGFTHTNNLFYLASPTKTQLGFTLSPTDKLGDPLLVDLPGNDFRLKAGSPAINAGADLGWTVDLGGKTVPCGAAPELGAYEFGC